MFQVLWDLRYSYQIAPSNPAHEKYQVLIHLTLRNTKSQKYSHRKFSCEINIE